VICNWRYRDDDGKDFSDLVLQIRRNIYGELSDTEHRLRMTRQILRFWLTIHYLFGIGVILFAISGKNAVMSDAGWLPAWMSHDALVLSMVLVFLGPAVKINDRRQRIRRRENYAAELKNLDVELLHSKSPEAAQEVFNRFVELQKNFRMQERDYDKPVP
jgi:hypothetical protein